MGARFLAVTAATAAFAFFSSAADAASPLRARVARCTPVSLGDSQGGAGGTADSRRVGIDLGLFTVAADDGVPLDALAATTRLEVCWTRAAGAGNPPDGECPGSVKPNGTPGDPAWVIFDDATQPLNRPGSKIADKAGLGKWILPSTGKGALPEQLIWLPVDWGSASNAGTIFFVRVNGEPIDFTQLTSAPALVAGGFCPTVEPMGAASDPDGGDFKIFGTPTTLADPFGGALGNVCTTGNHAGAGVPFDGNACAEQATATFIVNRMPAIGKWQKTVAMAQMSTPLDPPVWANGKCGAGFCPTHVLSYASDGASHGGLGLFHLWGVSGASDPFNWHAGATLRITSHEFWHNFEAAWGRGTKGAIDKQLWTEPFIESTATALESNLCFFDYPGGVPPGTCVAARHLGYNVHNGEWQNWLDAPHLNLLALEYTGSLFWRYAMEQFALPVDANNPAHPAGIGSSLPNLAPGAALSGRRADEGADLLGQVVQAYLDKPQAPSLDSIDRALRDNLGRGLDAFMLDLHTTALLKDYPDADPRWRLEWVGDYESGAAQQLECAAFPVGPCPLPVPSPPIAQIKAAGKFPVQPDLVSPATPSDVLHRTRRELDVYEPCTTPGCAPTLVPFGPDRTESSVQERYLPPYGATYLSAAPDAGLGSLRVRLVPRKGTQPRFRIFTVDNTGLPKAHAPCAVDPDGAAPDDTERCELNLDGVVDEVVPITPDVEEVLVVTSSGGDESRFTWKIGADKPRVVIVDPSASHPAPVGHPGPPDATRPFLAQLAVVDEAGEPLSGVDVTTVELSVPGCAGAAAPKCELANGTDFSVSEVGAGLYWAIGRLPAGFYTAPATKLDLAVAISGLAPQPIEATAPKALSVETAPQVVTQVVLDRSGSMASDAAGAKWEAAKVATKLVLDAIPDNELFGLVTFNQDAATPFPIAKLDGNARTTVQQTLDNLTPSGFTSVGDGLLEAQSNLVVAGFDLPDPTKPPPVLQTILLSDGISNSGYIPRRYYLYPPDAGFVDGAALPEGGIDDDPSDNVPWKTGATGHLSWPNRKGATPAGLVPSVSAVAIGEDAEPAELMTLADICQGAFSYVDPVTESVQFLKATIQMSDAFRLAMNGATGHERAFAGTATSLEQMPDLAVEPQAAELLVSVAAGAGGAETLRLIAPDGTVHEPAASSGTSAVFRAPSPMPGTWRFESLAQGGKPFAARVKSATTVGGGAPRVFVESALRTPISFVANADVAKVAAAVPREDESYESRRFATRPIVVRAAAVEGRPLAGVTIAAVVEPPGGSPMTLELADDGLHSDGKAGDGFYGAVLAATQRAGVYRIRLTATGTAAGGFPFRRERTLAVALHDGPDRDGDKLPDVWEEEVGTAVDRTDAGEDPDGDGLSNADELQRGTQPHRSDTDGGGEADGSEVAGGRDPLRPADDAVRPYAPTWKAGAGRGLVRVPAPAGTTVEVECGPSIDGPFAAAKTAPFGEEDLAVSLVDGQRACCRTRTVQSGAASAWSAPVCLVPASDPYPPRLALEPASGRNWSPTRRVRVRLVASDVAERPGRALAEDPAAISTGVRDMRVSQRADFAGAGWVPYEPEVEVTLEGERGGTVWAQVRDGAGNESSRRSLPLSIAAGTGLDRAIGLEEQALESMRNGKWREARMAVRQSRRELRDSLRTVRERIAQTGGDGIDRQIRHDLRRVLCRKWKAKLFAHRLFGDWAMRKLEKALRLERQVAELALRDHRPL